MMWELESKPEVLHTAGGGGIMSTRQTHTKSSAPLPVEPPECVPFDVSLRHNEFPCHKKAEHRTTRSSRAGGRGPRRHRGGG